MLIHGTDDGVVPVGDLARLAAARRAARPDAVTETLVVEGGRHSWLYEFPEYRAADRPVPRGEPRRPAHARRGGTRRRGRARRAPAGPRAADHARRGARRLPVAVAGAPAPGVGRVGHERRVGAGAGDAERSTATTWRRGAPRPRRDDPGMNVRDAVRTKRAVRSFDGRPLAQADLDRILDAGRRAHSSKNQQRWAFIVVRGPRAAAGAVDGRARSPATSPARRPRSRWSRRTRTARMPR